MTGQAHRHQHMNKFSPVSTNVIDGIRRKLSGKGEIVRVWIRANGHS